jgi:hypothetical protein
MPKKTAKPRQKKSKSDVTVTQDAIVITLNEEQKEKVRESIRKSGVAKFKIEEIKVKAIPGSGLTTAWIQF